MACYGPLLTPRAAVSQRFEENYEIGDQCDCPSHVYGASYAHNVRARLISEIGLSGFFRLASFRLESVVKTRVELLLARTSP